MELLIALGIGGVASITILTFAWVLTLEHDPSEAASDAFEDWFPEAYATEISEGDALAMWRGVPVAEVGLPTRPDTEAPEAVTALGPDTRP